MQAGKKSNEQSGSDWERVKGEAAQGVPVQFGPGDEPYDPNDAAQVAAFWKGATIKRGRGRPTVSTKRPTFNMRVDTAVLDAFKATGPGWQTRINALLTKAVKRGLLKAGWDLLRTSRFVTRQEIVGALLNQVRNRPNTLVDRQPIAG